MDRLVPARKSEDAVATVVSRKDAKRELKSSDLLCVFALRTKIKMSRIECHLRAALILILIFGTSAFAQSGRRSKTPPPAPTPIT